MPLTREIRVGDHAVYVLDSELPAEEVRRLYVELGQERRYSRSEAATAERFEIRHWATELELAEFGGSAVGRRTADLVGHYYPGEGQHAFRAYCNLNAYGDALSIHRDCAVSEGDVTALWFVCEEWERDWRGELLIFDQEYDAQAAITPRPGRLCLFRGLLPHAGTPPSRLCYKPRLTLVCKFAPAASAEGPAAGRADGRFETVPEVFAHMERRLARLPPRDFAATYRFVVEGPGGGTWHLQLARTGGQVTAADREADLTITLRSDTLLAILNRETGVARAFVLGRIKARGNLELAIHLREVIGPPGRERAG